MRKALQLFCYGYLIFTAFIPDGVVLKANESCDFKKLKETISLNYLIEAMSFDSNYGLFYSEYSDEELYTVKRNTIVTGNEKKVFLDRFVSWLDSDNIQLIDMPFLLDARRRWFCVHTRPEDEYDGIGTLAVYIYDQKSSNNSSCDSQSKIVRIEYSRPNKEHIADNFQWKKIIHTSDTVLPELPSGQPVFLDISTPCSDSDRYPDWRDSTLFFDICNLGTRSVLLKNVKMLSSNLLVDFIPSELPPGERTTLKVIVPPHAFHGYFVRYFILETDAPGQEHINLSIRGNMVKPIQIIPFKQNKQYIRESFPSFASFDGEKYIQEYSIQSNGRSIEEEKLLLSFHVIPHNRFSRVEVKQSDPSDYVSEELLRSDEDYVFNVSIQPNEKESIVRYIFTVNDFDYEEITPPPLELIIQYNFNE